MRLGNTRLVAVAVVAAGIVAVAAGDALARSRGSWGSAGSYGSSGGYASSGSYGGSYASYSSSGSYGGSYASYSSSGSAGSASSGSYGRPGLFARWHARKAARWSSSSGGYASSGSYGGSSASYSSSGSYGGYSSSGSTGSYGSAVYESYPSEIEVTSPEVPVEGAPTEATPPSAPSASATEATIFVSLPANAKVFVNDLATSSTGAERHYVSRGLKPGRSYSYKLRVQFDRDGKPVTEDKVVRLTAGENVQLAFGGAEAKDATAHTELKINVPAGAKVTLAGAPTEQTGEVRTYTTSSLNPGQKWNGYTVRVELEQDGKTLVEEKTLDIEGGQTYELAFELAGDSLKVAAN